MNTPIEVSVSPKTIKFSWTGISDVADTGRDAVIYYHVYWMKTVGNYVRLTNYPTTTVILSEYTHTLTVSDPF